MGEWISVNDRLPDVFGEYLVCWRIDGEWAIDMAFWTQKGFLVTRWAVSSADITHWMPLVPPEEERA